MSFCVSTGFGIRYSYFFCTQPRRLRLTRGLFGRRRARALPLRPFLGGGLGGPLAAGQLLGAAAALPDQGSRAHRVVPENRGLRAFGEREQAQGNLGPIRYLQLTYSTVKVLYVT